MFFIVRYDDGVTTVPLSWMIFEKSEFYLPHKNVHQEAQNGTPPRKSWQKLPFKQILGSCDYYEAGRKLQENFINDEGTAEEPSQKRARKVSSSEVNDDDNNNISPPLKKPKVSSSQRKVAPKLAEEVANILHIQSHYIKSNHQGSKAVQPEPETGNNSEQDHFPTEYLQEYLHECSIDNSAVASPLLTADDQTESAADEIESNSFNRDEPVDVQPSTSRGKPSIRDVVKSNITVCLAPGQISEVEHANCCNGCRSLLLKMLQNQTEILAFIRDYRGNGNHEPKEQELNLLPELPITNIVQLTRLNRELADETMKLQYKQMIKRVGGKDVKDHINLGLRRVIAINFGIRLTFTGKNNTIQIADMEFIKVTCEAIMEVYEKSTMDEVRHAMMAWFHRAGDRLRSAEKKNTHNRT